MLIELRQTASVGYESVDSVFERATDFCSDILTWDMFFLVKRHTLTNVSAKLIRGLCYKEREKPVKAEVGWGLGMNLNSTRVKTPNDVNHGCTPRGHRPPNQG